MKTKILKSLLWAIVAVSLAAMIVAFVKGHWVNGLYNAVIGLMTLMTLDYYKLSEFLYLYCDKITEWGNDMSAQRDALQEKLDAL